MLTGLRDTLIALQESSNRAAASSGLADELAPLADSVKSVRMEVTSSPPPPPSPPPLALSPNTGPHPFCRSKSLEGGPRRSASTSRRDPQFTLRG